MHIDMVCDGPTTLIWESQKDPKEVAKIERMKQKAEKQKAVA